MDDIVDNRVKILFLIPTMHAGGAERVVSIIVNNINVKKFSPTLALIKKEGVFLENISKNVSIIDLKSERTRSAWFKVIKLIWNQKPDVVFSTLGHLNLMIAALKFFLPRRTRYIARETSIVSINNPNEKYPALFDFLFKTVYKRFDLVICQSHYMKNDLISNFSVPERKLVVINNPVDVPFVRSQMKEANTEKRNSNITFLAVGRLSKEKGTERLIKAFALVKNPKIHLNIVGDGVLKEELMRLASHLGLGHKISFLGLQKNPYQWMAHAKALIIPSHYEGFPNVAIEANACGIPVIAFESPGAISEIIVEKSNGWLIENDDIVQLAAKIDEVAVMDISSNPIVERVVNTFNLDLIINKYEQAFLGKDAALIS